MTANLLSRLQGLTGPDREVDALICVALQYGGPNSEGAANVRRDPDWDEDDVIFEVGSEACCNRIPELTSSLDATVALCERFLPGWQWAVWGGAIEAGSTKPRCMAHVSNGFRQWTADDCPTPAIALLIAILTALEARENG